MVSPRAGMNRPVRTMIIESDAATRGFTGAKIHFHKLFKTGVNLPAIRGKNFFSPLLVSTNLAAC
jgi:hypothetical protein